MVVKLVDVDPALGDEELAVHVATRLAARSRTLWGGESAEVDSTGEGPLGDLDAAHLRRIIGVMQEDRKRLEDRVVRMSGSAWEAHWRSEVAKAVMELSQEVRALNPGLDFSFNFNLDMVRDAILPGQE